MLHTLKISRHTWLGVTTTFDWVFQKVSSILMTSVKQLYLLSRCRNLSYISAQVTPQPNPFWIATVAELPHNQDVWYNFLSPLHFFFFLDNCLDEQRIHFWGPMLLVEKDMLLRYVESHLRNNCKYEMLQLSCPLLFQGLVCLYMWQLAFFV